MALRSPSGTALEQFETFLSHRGEEMGSIRGQVKVHVPADYRRAARSKIYGWSKRATGLSELTLRSHYLLTFLFLPALFSCETLSVSSICLLI